MKYFSAKKYIMAMIVRRTQHMAPKRPREQQAEDYVLRMFRDAGWSVTPPDGQPDGGVDLRIERGPDSYLVEVKGTSEGRSDRLIPLWSQALLEVQRTAAGRHRVLPIVAAPTISPRVADQILRFAADNAPGVSAGVVDFAGFRRFVGSDLLDLNTESSQPSISPLPRSESDLFSDLNQWMLKVLIAPEVPASMLSAPRGRYASAAELAGAAQVSPVSAFRFVRGLQEAGYLDNRASYLNLVRRPELFDRWRAAVDVRRPKESGFRFLFRGNPESDLRDLMRESEACLGLFAAAERMHVGFVSGVPPHIYVRRFDHGLMAQWRNASPLQPWEPPDFFVRQSVTPESIFRGSVVVEGLRTSDVVQVWLDVSSHPTRGPEQAELIKNRILARAMEAS